MPRLCPPAGFVGKPGGKVSCLVFVLLTSGLFFIFLPGQLYGLEKFWAFLKYSKAKNLDINSKLQEYLSKFKRLEDFRVDVSRHNSCTTLVAPANSPSEHGGLWGSPSAGRRGGSDTYCHSQSLQPGQEQTVGWEYGKLYPLSVWDKGAR